MWFSILVEWSKSSKNNNLTILMLNIVSMNLHMHNVCIYIYISIVRDRDGEESGGRQGDREMETDRLKHMYAENEDFFFF